MLKVICGGKPYALTLSFMPLSLPPWHILFFGRNDDWWNILFYLQKSLHKNYLFRFCWLYETFEVIILLAFLVTISIDAIFWYSEYVHNILIWTLKLSIWWRKTNGLENFWKMQVSIVKGQFLHLQLLPFLKIHIFLLLWYLFHCLLCEEQKSGVS